MKKKVMRLVKVLCVIAVFCQWNYSRGSRRFDFRAEGNLSRV